MDKTTEEDSIRTTASAITARIPHAIDHQVEVREPHRPFSVPGSREAVLRFSDGGRYPGMSS